MVAVAASSDGRLAASAGWDRTLRIWDLGTGTQIHALKSDANLTAVQITSDDQTVVAGATDGDLHLWRLADGTQLGELAGHDFGLTMLESMAVAMTFSW